jgi:hypothetical protein
MRRAFLLPLSADVRLSRPDEPSRQLAEQSRSTTGSRRRLERTAQAERAEAISIVRLRAKAACDAPWWEDDYCLRRVKATAFTGEKMWNGVWRVREHIRGDRRFQDICWLVEPAEIPRPVDMSLGWPVRGLSPASCASHAFFDLLMRYQRTTKR